MSDGGILMSDAFGFDSNELAKALWVKPDWLKHRQSQHAELLARSARAFTDHYCGPTYDRKTGKNVVPTTPRPALPKDTVAFFDAVAKGENPFPEWSWNEEKVVNAIHEFNQGAVHNWYHILGFAKEYPRDARIRRKAGFTSKITPAQWKEHRHLWKRHRIANAAKTKDIWAYETEQLMEFLTGQGGLRDGISMEARKPKLHHRVAGNVVWYLGHLGWLPDDEIDICTDCGRVIMTDRETHDWCSKCGKMRCEGCSTAPSHCQCDYPCAKHCKCKEEEA